jgi:DNA-binding LytR/AlgR family response regulator
VFHRDDFVLLTGEGKICILRVQDISLLEAHRNFTLVHFPGHKLIARRTLRDCERKLKASIFFRAKRGCVVNLTYVKQPRLLKNGRIIFLLKDGKEVVFSRRQSILFRKTRGF